MAGGEHDDVIFKGKGTQTDGESLFKLAVMICYDPYFSFSKIVQTLHGPPFILASNMHAMT